jgi:uncharacterized protein (TIGR03435 family)
MRTASAFVVLTGLLLFTPFTRAQATEAPLSFEVAAVKQSSGFSTTGMDSRGGPGTADPGQFTSRASLRTFLLKAFGVRNYPLSGPDWLDSEGFEIVAKVPKGTTKEQLDKMLQSLMVDRFRLTYHHEAREMSVYELLVKESDLSVQRPPRDPGSPIRPPGTDAKGFLLVGPGPSQFIGRTTNGIIRWTGGQQPISGLATLLENELERPVVDKTGLTGRYDIQLMYSRDGLKPLRKNPAAPVDTGPADDDIPSGGPSLMKAVEQQLGLRLQSAKDPIDVLVLDHIDRMPTEN